MRFGSTFTFSICCFGMLAPPTASAVTPVVIVTPQDGAVVPPQFAVKVTFGDVKYCDTDGCEDIAADELNVWADSSSIVADCYPCSDEADFDVMLTPGQHELEAIAIWAFNFEKSEPITIVVEDPTTGGESASSSSGDSTGAGSGSSADTGDSTTSGANTPTGDGTNVGDNTSTSDSGSAGNTTGLDGEPAKKDGCACDLASDPKSGLVWLVALLLTVSRRRLDRLVSVGRTAS